MLTISSTDEPLERTKAVVVEHVEAGRLRLALHHAGPELERIGLGWSTGQGPDAELSPLGRAMQAALERYARGREPQWPEVDLPKKGLPRFTVQVLRVLRQEVGFGRVVSYGELAGLAGNERAARAVGGALARNLLPLLVPCHRVVGAGGALTGFTNPCGLEMKRYLLELESTGSDRA